MRNLSDRGTVMPTTTVDIFKIKKYLVVYIAFQAIGYFYLISRGGIQPNVAFGFLALGNTATALAVLVESLIRLVISHKGNLSETYTGRYWGFTFFAVFVFGYYLLVRPNIEELPFEIQANPFWMPVMLGSIAGTMMYLYGITGTKSR